MIIIMFILGTLLGSFYLVVGLRLPVDKDVIYSRSKCDVCETQLKWYNLIPIISYICQRGKCTNCKTHINCSNLIVELMTGLIFAYLYVIFGFSYELYVSLIISSLLVIICVSDFIYMIINDSPLIVAIILKLFLDYYYFGLSFMFLNIASGLFMFFFFYFIGFIGSIMFKKEALGGGDIKFAFVIGQMVGFLPSMYTLILSSFLALPASVFTISLTKNKEVPYGPFLAGALLIIYLNLDKLSNLII